MKRRVFIGLILLSAVYLMGCNKDGEKPIEKGEKVESSVATLQAFQLKGPEGYDSYVWSIKNKDQWDQVSNEKDFSSALADAGEYSYRVEAKKSGSTFQQLFTVTVNPPSKPYADGVAKVYDFLQAPGQFVNKGYPTLAADATQEQVNATVLAALATESSSVTLGAFGGYVVFGFDHVVLNKTGEYDLKILGNVQFANSSEPGRVMVSFDANANGKPDDEWYDIAGSAYKDPKTMKDYEVTYYRPDPLLPKDPNDATYIRWTDNKGNEGYVKANSYHEQSYWPLYAGNSEKTELKFKGIRLPDNKVVDQWVSWTPFEYGYVDNVSASEDAGIKIDWAVDAQGNSVHLPGINFVKVYTGTLQDGASAGENSTEVDYAQDLHLKKS